MLSMTLHSSWDTDFGNVRIIRYLRVMQVPTIGSLKICECEAPRLVLLVMVLGLDEWGEGLRFRRADWVSVRLVFLFFNTWKNVIFLLVRLTYWIIYAPKMHFYQICSYVLFRPNCQEDINFVPDCIRWYTHLLALYLIHKCNNRLSSKSWIFAAKMSFASKNRLTPFYYYWIIFEI